MAADPEINLRVAAMAAASLRSAFVASNPNGVHDAIPRLEHAVQRACRDRPAHARARRLAEQLLKQGKDCHHWIYNAAKDSTSREGRKLADRLGNTVQLALESANRRIAAADQPQ